MSEAKTLDDKKKLQWYEHLACGWPLVLVGIGGALGGLCGGAAYVISAKIFRKEIPSTKKYIYAILVGLSAIVVYLLALVVLALIFPDLFPK